MRIQLLVDNTNSWIFPYAQDICQTLLKLGHDSILLSKHEDVEEGDILCILSCEKKFKKLNLNKNNLVVHESDLPKGKGWSPLTWQIIEGKDQIPVTLFEATEDFDSGVIYAQKILKLNGSELLPELRELQAKATKELIFEFIANYPKNRGLHQEGQASFYSKRSAKDSILDINKTILDQFNLLRVCDNERYPAFFYFQDEKYILKIEKEIK